MKFNIEYTSFNLSKGTENIIWTERAEWFFRDHNLEHEIVYNNSNVKCIQWSEKLVVNNPIHTLHVLHNYAEIYNCQIIVEKDLYTIIFNEV